MVSTQRTQRLSQRDAEKSLCVPLRKPLRPLRLIDFSKTIKLVMVENLTAPES